MNFPTEEMVYMNYVLIAHDILFDFMKKYSNISLRDIKTSFIF